MATDVNVCVRIRRLRFEPDPESRCIAMSIPSQGGEWSVRWEDRSIGLIPLYLPIAPSPKDRTTHFFVLGSCSGSHDMTQLTAISFAAPFVVPFADFPCANLSLQRSVCSSASATHLPHSNDPPKHSTHTASTYIARSTSSPLLNLSQTYHYFSSRAYVRLPQAQRPVDRHPPIANSGHEYPPKIIYRSTPSCTHTYPLSLSLIQYPRAENVLLLESVGLYLRPVLRRSGGRSVLLLVLPGLSCAGV